MLNWQSTIESIFHFLSLSLFLSNLYRFAENLERTTASKIPASIPSANERKTVWFKRRKEDKNKMIVTDSPSRDSNCIDSTSAASDKNACGGSFVETLLISKQTIQEKIKALGLDFFSEDFEGVTASSIQCLACETTTEQKETMIDLAVPITENMETHGMEDTFIKVWKSRCKYLFNSLTEFVFFFAQFLEFMYNS